MQRLMINILLLILIGFLSCDEINQHCEPLPRHYPLKEAGLKNMELWDPPETTIHIDPLNINGLNRDGSFEQPFISFDEVTCQDGGVYAIKRGTILETGTIMVFADDVILASYGEGERPIIRSTSEAHAVSTDWDGGHNITVRDIEIYAPNATSCLIFRSNSTNVRAVNLKLHGAKLGLRALNHIDGLYVYSAEIFDIADDSIQLYLCNNWHVHNNIIDRSDTGNKFCFISNNPEQDKGVFEYNVLKGPRYNGASIYIGDGRNLIFRYNHIAGPSPYSFYSHADDLKIYYNIFNDFSGPLFVSGSAVVYNNLFYKTSTGIEGGRVIAINNIFDLGAVDRTRFNVKELTESNNIFVWGLPTRNSKVGDPCFVDPVNGDFRLLPDSECIDNGFDVDLG